MVPARTWSFRTFRSLSFLSLAIAAAALPTACSSAKKSPDGSGGVEIPEEPARYDAADPAWGTSPVASTPAPEESPEVASTPHAPRTHVVKKGDTLFSLARQYYEGDMSKWRRIYDANRDQIPDKDRIRIGQEFVIPD